MLTEGFAFLLKLAGWLLLYGFGAFVALKILAGIAKGVIAWVAYGFLRAHKLDHSSAWSVMRSWLLEEKWSDLLPTYNYWKGMKWTTS